MKRSLPYSTMLLFKLRRRCRYGGSVAMLTLASVALAQSSLEPLPLLSTPLSTPEAQTAGQSESTLTLAQRMARSLLRNPPPSTESPLVSTAPLLPASQNPVPPTRTSLLQPRGNTMLFSAFQEVNQATPPTDSSPASSAASTSSQIAANLRNPASQAPTNDVVEVTLPATPTATLDQPSAAAAAPVAAPETTDAASEASEPADAAPAASNSDLVLPISPRNDEAANSDAATDNAQSLEQKGTEATVVRMPPASNTPPPPPATPATQARAPRPARATRPAVPARVSPPSAPAAAPPASSPAPSFPARPAPADLINPPQMLQNLPSVGATPQIITARGNTPVTTSVIRPSRSFLDAQTQQVQQLQASTASAALASQRYVVQQGDYLIAIGRKLYNGDERGWRRILAANPQLNNNPDLITPGMTLVIPR